MGEFLAFGSGFFDSLTGFLVALFWFVVVLTPIVFVHELGHYWIAILTGVRVDAFSVGFGPELFGRTDRRGTRWKVSLFPFGGYVKMFGQSDVGADADGESLSQEERKLAFSQKTVGQRSAIVVAGPVANFVAAIALLAVLFATVGQAFTPAVVISLVPDAPAELAGFQVGDKITAVNGSSVQRFEELQQLVRINPGTFLDVRVERGGAEINIAVTPAIEVATLPDGLVLEYGVLGIRGPNREQGREYVRHNPIVALAQAARETGRTIALTFTAIGQMISGDRSAKQLGGPIQIAQLSESAASGGLESLIFLAAFLSINLGLINLFPIPLLDGGHLVFYLYEAVFRKPMALRAQDIGFKIGLVLVLGLMLFATRNDLIRYLGIG